MTAPLIGRQHLGRLPMIAPFIGQLHTDMGGVAARIALLSGEPILRSDLTVRGGTVLIASGDRDTFQLASNRTTILYPVRAGEMARIDPAEVRARYGVDPGQVPDFIALRGDPSDKLPGAPGVGATGAATLLQRYGNLEAALAEGRFPAQAENLRLYRSIATMNKKAPLPSLRRQKPTWRKAAALAREWELQRLAGRLEELGSRGSAAEQSNR
jgi:DNA polymerase-1